LLVSLDAAAAEEVARKLMGDSSQDAALRANAFRILLYVLEDDAAQKEAVLALREGSDERQGAALALLARGRGALQQALEEGDSDARRADLFDGLDPFGSQAREAALPAVPEGLTADLLRPLVHTGKSQQRADAGYLLCLLGEAEGLPPLVELWKQEGRNDQELTKMLYRSIAALDDSASVPLLAEIYQLLSAKDDVVEQEVAAFYWTIRTMTGPEALALRKRIRDEVGIDNLQRSNPFGDAFPASRF
jgi:hypothetical protein